MLLLDHDDKVLYQRTLGFIIDIGYTQNFLIQIIIGIFHFVADLIFHLIIYEYW